MNGSRSPLALILGLIFVTTIGWSTAATRAAAAGGFAQPPGSSAAAAIERVGAYPYGPALAVAVDPVRKLIFLGSGGAVLVLDGSDVTAPSLLYDEIRTYGLVLDAAYDEATQRLYLACGEGGLEIWDLAEPTAPVRLSHVEVTYFGYDTPVGTVVVHGHFCVVECEWGYVHALDVSDPTHPVQVGFNGTMGNPARDIYLSPEDDTIHTTGAQNWVRLYLDGTGTLYSAGDKHFTQGPVAVAGTPEVSYVGYAGYLYIIDLLDPRLPFWSETFVGGIGDIVEEDGFIYFTNSTGLHVWDTRTYNDPVLVGSAGPDLYDYRLALADGYVYVAAGSDGLRIYQTAPTAAGAIDPQAPVLVGTFPSLAVTWDTIVSGDVAYLSHSLDGTFTLDLENLEAPERIGESPSFGETRDAALAGNVLYVADWTGGVRILDVSDPTDPTEIGVFDGASAWRVAVENGILYVIDGVANEQDTLYSIDVSDPANPVVLDSFRLGLLNWDLLLVGSFLYVGGGDDGVRILDVSDPAAMVQVSTFPAPSANGLFWKDGLLYIASAAFLDGGLFIVDVSDPTAPSQASHYGDAGFAPRHVWVAGDYAYVDEFDDLVLFYVGDPSNPVRLDEDYTTPDSIFEISGRDDLIFVSNGRAGLQILRNTFYEDPTGGLVWQPQTSGTTQDLEDVFFLDADRGWAVGDGGTLLVTQDGGVIWTSQASGVSVTLRAIEFLDQNIGFTGGDGGRILKSIDGGATWSPLTTGTSDAIFGLDFVDASRGWACGDNGTMLHTTDGGVTWTRQVTGTTLGLPALSFPDANTGYATVGDFGHVLRTSDGGASWHTVSTGAPNILAAIDFVDATTGWAVGSFGEIVKTTDRGLSWTEQTGVFPPDWLYGVDFIDEQTGWIVGFDGKIMTTKDGESWEQEGVGERVELHAVSFVGAQHGWSVGNDGLILHTERAPAGLPDPEAGTRLLLSSAPNPFGRSTSIRYRLEKTTSVRLAVFGVSGAHVRTLVDGVEPAGDRLIEWDGTDDGRRPVGAGLYFLRLDTNGEAAARRLLKIR